MIIYKPQLFSYGIGCCGSIRNGFVAEVLPWRSQRHLLAIPEQPREQGDASPENQHGQQGPDEGRGPTGGRNSGHALSLAYQRWGRTGHEKRPVRIRAVFLTGTVNQHGRDRTADLLDPNQTRYPCATRCGSRRGVVSPAPRYHSATDHRGLSWQRLFQISGPDVPGNRCALGIGTHALPQPEVAVNGQKCSFREWASQEPNPRISIKTIGLLFLSPERTAAWRDDSSGVGGC